MMTSSAKSQADNTVSLPPCHAEDGISPEDREELEFFRRISELSQEASGRELQRLTHPAESDEEERAFIAEMMKESRRTTAREIERRYGPIEVSE